MELEKIVRLIGSFILALFIVAIPFICALSFVLNWGVWGVFIKLIFTLMTIGYIAIETLYIYYESEG